MAKSIAMGDRVRLSSAFLNAMGCYDKEIADQQGTVTAVQRLNPSMVYVTVQWDGEEGTRGSLAKNLHKVGEPEYWR
jgi:hypothetical protein